MSDDPVTPNNDMTALDDSDNLDPEILPNGPDQLTTLSLGKRAVCSPQLWLDSEQLSGQLSLL